HLAAMDKILISELEVSYRIGVTAEERARPQRLLLSVEMAHDFKSAAAHDALTETIDYAAVCERLLHFGDDSQWQLIEKLAEDLADMILKEFSPKQVSIEVKKFAVPKTRYVAVALTRPR